MKAFIADLDRRAAHIRTVTKREQFQFCSHCREPLAMQRMEQRPTDLRDYCDVCAELFLAAFGRRYFREIQIDVCLQRAGLGRLWEYLNP